MSLRALRKGVVMATRTKKSWVFIALFVILTTLSILSMNNVYAYETNQLIDIRGYVFRPKEQISEAEFENSNFSLFLKEIKAYTRGIYVVFRGEIPLARGVSIGVLWISPVHSELYYKEMPWVIEEIKPTKIESGRTIDFNKYRDVCEGVIPKDFEIEFPMENISVSFDRGRIVFPSRVGGMEINISIVGKSLVKFDDFWGSEVQAKQSLFVTSAAIEALEDSIINISVARVIVTVAGGSAASPWNINKIEENKKRIEEKLSEYSDRIEFKYDRPGISPREYMSSVSLTGISLLLVLMLGGMYAFILVSFRKFDIATLRAIGWGSGHIRALVIGEFSLTMVVGYIFGTIVGGILLVSYRVPITPFSFLISLATLLFSIVIGLLIISKRVLKIPPMEAFRAR